jgi:lipopolysaccharide export LptBFGC system permease protein LptF
MFENFLKIKLIDVYIFRTFFIKFLVVLIFATFLGGLIEIASSFGKFNMLKFFLNVEEIFSFVFFISSAWVIIQFQKTREFIIMQSSTFSVIKIFSVFMVFAMIWSLFYLFVYNGLFLKNISEKSDDYQILNKLEIYNQLQKPCDYNVFIFKSIGMNHKLKSFRFATVDMLNFTDCKFTDYKTLENGKILNSDNQVNIITEKLNVQTHYNYNVFASYFQEKLDTKSFKTFFERLHLKKNFKKFNVDYRNIEIEIMKTLQKILSFFYTIAISFLFFAKIPPRGKIIIKFFISICFMACIYIINIIISSYVEKSILLNPIFIITPSIILFFTILFILIFKKV